MRLVTYHLNDAADDWQHKLGAGKLEVALKLETKLKGDRIMTFTMHLQLR